LAAARGAQHRLIECRLVPELVHQRLTDRASRQDGSSDANWEIYQRQRGEFEPETDTSPTRYLALDTNVSVSAAGSAATAWLREHDVSNT